MCGNWKWKVCTSFYKLSCTNNSAFQEQANWLQSETKLQWIGEVTSGKKKKTF